ncbi:ubiquitin carboxyl-terminal hydrolase [Capsaspora owczarzaki ATCC 30864]|uniref:ubiquitin carboxyl-terminal hydrolase n=1 Tax=Capsaspora owczarzaki (strain ATCC 30864) TaxID=595528 RepID=UPI0001FE37FF|nr:ubiquitin carboxyl-terminal hydrolase [Capsaspora owczarzaki ATCC 30864]|eukprot:XP_004345237.1 ubiquitin carboxyl-terminal hydrolase [Capsaspora owczarzaki ATCC 30864]
MASDDDAMSVTEPSTTTAATASTPQLSGQDQPVPSPAAQHDRILDMRDNWTMVRDETAMVISARWFARWERCVRPLDATTATATVSDAGADADAAAAAVEAGNLVRTALTWTEDAGLALRGIVGPIDNSSILTEDGLLRPSLLMQTDYELLPLNAWNLLLGWYGAIGHPIERQVISESDHLRVEVYPLNIILSPITADTPDLKPTTSATRAISKQATLSALKKVACLEFDLPLDDRTRLYFDDVKKPLDQNMEKSSLAANYLFDGCKITIEQKLPSGEWPSDVTQRAQQAAAALRPLPAAPAPMAGTRSSLSSFGSSSYPTRSIRATVHGALGLRNLGNTCFMNSGLQCLSNSMALTRYFVDDSYLRDVNTTNPLGMRGELAQEYGELVKALWSDNPSSSVSPFSFKYKLSMFAPQFNGYQQHDSQELLAFLLDGLHEDLNRVTKKPYIEAKDANGRPDAEVADEMWHMHKQRNDSIIVDLFQGQFKSTLVCPVCDRVSITFDPFMYLSLPLPEKRYAISVTVVLRDPQRRPICVKVRVPKDATVFVLRQALADLLELRADSILLVETYQSKIDSRLENTEPCAAYFKLRHGHELYAYEVDTIERHHHLINVCFLQSNFETDTAASGRFVGRPIICSFPREDVSGAEVYEVVMTHMRPYFNKQDVNDEGSEMATEDSEYPFSLIYLDHHAEFPASLHIVPNDATPVSWATGFFGIRWLPDALADAGFDQTLYLARDDHESTRETSGTSVSLGDCMQLFLKQEQLGADDPWYCSQCKQHQQAYKKFDLWRAPETLVVHLKRFSFSRYSRSKLETHVDFPITDFNLAEYMCSDVTEPLLYDLYAVSNHFGGLGGGHFPSPQLRPAYALNEPSGRWFNFDDSSVSPAEARDALSSSAYVLFYRRKRTPPAESQSAAMSDGEN